MQAAALQPTSRSRRAVTRERTPFGALAAVAERIAAKASSVTFPTPRWQDDPAAFAREVLGAEPWSRQEEILRAVVPERSRVAVSSGHKVAKSHTAAILALWFYCSFPDARVVMSSTTARQVNQILWRELRKMHARSRLPIDGEPSMLASSGLKSHDFREVVGFTAREAEAVAGTSGANLLYILDEASGIPEVIFEAIEGNRAGGARVVMFSNPTRTEGAFYDAFASKSEFYTTIRISSEETPNVVQRRTVIPGLATYEWVEEKKREWGVDSPLYKIRVKGEHVLTEDGKILTVDAITQAEARWEDTLAEGRLHLGVDPAGPGEGGDETAIAVRRGQKVLAIYTWRGISAGAILANVRGLVAEHRLEGEPAPLVKLDREGPIGSEVMGLFLAHLESHESEFTLVTVKASATATREGMLYDRVRDELWANLARWISEGGAIPEDTRLAKELHAPEWLGQLNGKLKVTPKSDLRKLLHRSPDRADAVCLAVWDDVGFPYDDEPSRQTKRDDDYWTVDDTQDPGVVFNPYVGSIG